MEFVSFKKIPRLFREMTITEKIDGTNACIYIGEDGEFLTGSRNRWITPDDDNYGFSRWAHEHREELLTLGTGLHYGEWWGSGIQRKYDLKEKRFSLFNVGKWNPGNVPGCCQVVPILYSGIFEEEAIHETLAYLKTNGSDAATGFMRPEGIVVYLNGNLYKVTLDGDGHKNNH